MIHKLSLSLTNYLTENGADKSKHSIYAYGIECFLNALFSNILLILLGILTHQLIPLIIYSISFTLIRINIGGFHAPTSGLCILFGLLVDIISIHLNPLWQFYYPLLPCLLLLFSFIFILRYAPIVHKNHPVSDDYKKKTRTRGLLFLLLESGLAFFYIPIVHTILHLYLPVFFLLFLWLLYSL